MNKDEDLLNYSEILETVEEWRGLSELQRKIIYTHISHPEFNKTEIARNVGCQVQSVWKVFHTKWFNTLNVELAKIEKRELLQLALKALKESLSSTTPQVKLSAAIKVLTDAEVLQLEKQDNKELDKVTVVWGEKKPDVDTDTLSTAHKTTVSTLLSGKI